MSVFISYSRRDQATVDALRGDIARAQLAVWLDEDLTGGQAWWDTILQQIRTSDLFVFALSPDSLHSKACTAELQYALALGRPILPVMVADVAVQLAPPAIANAQIIDYRHRTADTAIALMGALARRPAAPPLPPTLPAPPPIPISYMSTYREQVESPSLTYLQQTQLLTELKGHLRDEYSAEVAAQLIRRLRERGDIAEAVGRDIDALLPTLPAAAAPATATAAAPAAGWHPDPLRRAEQRYWDGSAWTEHVSGGGRQYTDRIVAREPAAARGFAAPAAKPQTPQTAGTVAAFTTGAFAGLIVASLFCGGIAGIVAGLANLKHPNRRSQATTLLVIGGIVLALSLVLVASNIASQPSNF